MGTDTVTVTVTVTASHLSFAPFPGVIMASGFGYSGGRSRCHPFWQEFVKCYQAAEQPTQCSNQRADYIECLHHTKEIKRAQIVKSHYLQSQKQLLPNRRHELEPDSPQQAGRRQQRGGQEARELGK